MTKKESCYLAVRNIGMDVCNQKQAKILNDGGYVCSAYRNATEAQK